MLSPSHGAHAPMRGRRWLAMQSCFHDLLHASGRNRRLASSPGRIFGERRRSAILETPSPQDDARSAGSQFLSNPAVGFAFRGQQHNARPKDHLLRRVARRHPTGQCASLFLGQLQRIGHGPHHTRTMTRPFLYVKLFMRHYASYGLVEQLAVAPPLEPMHIHDHGPESETTEAVPDEHKLLLGGFCFYSCTEIMVNTLLQAYFQNDFFRHAAVWQLSTMSSFVVALVVWAAALRKPLPVEDRRLASTSDADYQRLSPEINEDLRRLNEKLLRLWKLEAREQ